jgi:hypothetical protein
MTLMSTIDDPSPASDNNGSLSQNDDDDLWHLESLFSYVKTQFYGHVTREELDDCIFS